MMRVALVPLVLLASISVVPRQRQSLVRLPTARQVRSKSRITVRNAENDNQRCTPFVDGIL